MFTLSVFFLFNNHDIVTQKKDLLTKDEVKPQGENEN